MKTIYEKVKIPSLPTAVSLIKTKYSPVWYVTVFMVIDKKKKVFKKSTRTEQKSTAIKFAREYYEEIILKKNDRTLIITNPFSKFCDDLLKENKRDVLDNKTSEDDYKITKNRIENYLLEFFGDKDVSTIDYSMLSEYVDVLRKRKLSDNTIKKYLITIRKVLKQALRQKVISQLPVFPNERIKIKDNPKSWIRPDELKKLYSYTNNLRKDLSIQSKKTKTEMIQEEMYDFIVFMIHSFLRPSEVKLLQHRHIEVRKYNNVEQLNLSLEKSKTNRRITSTTTDVACEIYKKRLLKNDSKKDDYVFINWLSNRDYAIDEINRVFKDCCKESNCETDIFGTLHTTYSLRHTSLCNHIIQNEGSNLYTLSLNSRTSVQMLERFYLSHLQSNMKEFAVQLQSRQIKEII